MFIVNFIIATLAASWLWNDFDLMFLEDDIKEVPGMWDLFVKFEGYIGFFEIDKLQISY